MILRSARVITGNVRIGLVLEIGRYESKIDTREGRTMMLYAKLSLQKHDGRGAGRPLIMRSFTVGCRKEDIGIDNGSFDGLTTRFGCARL